MSSPPAICPRRMRSRCLLEIPRANSRAVSSGISSSESRFFVRFMDLSFGLGGPSSADDPALVFARLREDHNQDAAAGPSERDESVFIAGVSFIVDLDESEGARQHLVRFFESNSMLRLVCGVL